MSNSNCCCISNILENIVTLQNNCGKLENMSNSCDRPCLGANMSNSFVYNTRPINLYNCNNTLFTFPYTTTVDGETTTGTSSVLRIEKVNGCCATFRILAPNPDTTSVLPYIATDDFATVNLDCVCILICLPDTSISCI